MWLACGVLSAGACRGITDEGPGAQRIVLDLSRLVGGAAAPPDFVSVLDTARLRVGAGGTETSQALPLGQSDSTVTFEVTVPSGSVRFRLDVTSNNQMPLYVADTTVTIDADNFAVPIAPRAVNGVMVVWPRNPPYDTTFFFRRRQVKVARWALRNAGSDSLQWNVDSSGTDGAAACFTLRETNCFFPQTLNPSLEPDTVIVVFDSIPPDSTRMITFTSTVGQASFATGVP